MSGYRVSAREGAVGALQAAVRAAAVEVFGAARVQTPIEGHVWATREGLDDPLAGVRAAVLARGVAVAALRDYAMQARGAGRSWDDVGAALGLASGPGAGDGPRGEQAYLLLVEGRPLPEDAPSWSRWLVARWTCAACGQRVTDTGPFEASPLNTEDGHAGDCPRHAAETADGAG